MPLAPNIDSGSRLREALPQGHVHAWTWKLAMSPARLTRLWSYLAPQEQERAERLAFPEVRDRFVAGRGQLRAILGRYLETDPASLRLLTRPAGKPYLAPERDGDPLFFSLAHADDLALLAVARGVEVGADVEPVGLPAESASLADQFFSPREAQSFRALPENARAMGFTNLWTRKEALLKAKGEGIAHRLREVEVTFQPGEPAAIVSLPADWGSEWSLEALSPTSGYQAAIAAACPLIILHPLSFSTGG